jgi:hypothetical protein
LPIGVPNAFNGRRKEAKTLVQIVELYMYTHLNYVSLIEVWRILCSLKGIEQPMDTIGGSSKRQGIAKNSMARFFEP